MDCVRLGVSISDQALAQSFDFDTTGRHHGIQELPKIFGGTRRSTPQDVDAYAGQQREQSPDIERACDLRCAN